MPSTVPVIPIPSLSLTHVRFELEALDPIRAPPYSGSAWRGLLGGCLRHAVCVTRQPTCDGCLLRTQCVYSTFFESPAATPEISRRYRALPHPFVLQPTLGGPQAIKPGEPLGLGMMLIGPAGQFIPHLVHAMQRAGSLGLGREGGRFRLRGLHQETQIGSDHWQVLFDGRDGVLHPVQTAPQAIGACRDPLRLQLLTPMRLKRRGRFVDASQLDARDLLSTLAARVAVLAELYAQEGAPLDLDAVHAAIDQVQLTSEGLRWVDWTRWSSRQQTHMQLGGLLGTLILSGSVLPALWPLIALGQWLHVGKATSFGLGRYRIAPTGNQ